MRTFYLILVLAYCLISAIVMAGVTHQGRLLDGVGQPISGSYDITYRLFTDSTGGSPVWQEIHSISFTDGLFSVILGDNNPLEFTSYGIRPDSLWLEMQISGEPVLSPRTRLSSTPMAEVAASIVNNGSLQVGSLVILDSLGDTSMVLTRGSGTLIKLHPPQNTKFEAGKIAMIDSVGDTTYSTKSQDDGVITTYTWKQTSGPYKFSNNTILNDDGVLAMLSSDGNNDSNPESSAKTMVTADSTRDWLDTDSDDDGISDVSSIIKTSASGVSHSLVWNSTSSSTRRRGDVKVEDIQCSFSLSSDEDGDDIPENEASMTVFPTKSSVAIKTKGTGADKDRSAITSETNDSMAVTTSSMDSDDDGITDVSSSITTTPNGVSHTFLWNSTSSQARQKASVTCGDIEVKRDMISDIDGDGNPEAINEVVVTNNSIIEYRDLDSDDDGIPEVEYSNRVLPTSASFAIKTKGTGADPNRSSGVSSEVNDTLALHESGIDLDDDGFGDVGTISACTIDSVYESSTFHYPNAAFPTSISGMAFRARKSKSYLEMHDTEVASKTTLEFSCDSATSSSIWSSDDFSGLPATTLIIQASSDPLVNPIEHSSGAHLTAGGSWTNSSDANLKENFQLINGEELLDKIEELNISEWNYISESDNVKHIGPTAQDFEKTFNLGTDGKSISTIDPAGIALAAIKALNAKSKKVDELEAKVNELTKLVEKLLKEKK